MFWTRCYFDSVSAQDHIKFDLKGFLSAVDFYSIFRHNHILHSTLWADTVGSVLVSHRLPQVKQLTQNQTGCSQKHTFRCKSNKFCVCFPGLLEDSPEEHQDTMWRCHWVPRPLNTQVQSKRCYITIPQSLSQRTVGKKKRTVINTSRCKTEVRWICNKTYNISLSLQRLKKNNLRCVRCSIFICICFCMCIRAVCVVWVCLW